MNNNIIVIKGTVTYLKETGASGKATVFLTSVADKTMVEEIYPDLDGVFHAEVSNEISYSIQAQIKTFKSALFFIPKKVRSVYLDLHIHN